MPKYIIPFIIAIYLISNSCVSESEHEKVLSANASLQNKVNALQRELDEIKFGAPALLSEGRKFYDAQEFEEARKKFQLLVEKHPEMSISIEAKRYLANIDEEELWYKAKTSEEPYFVENYINDYPNGVHISDATLRKSVLIALNMQNAYNNCVNTNTSTAWKAFLKTYPDHIEKDEIIKRIIRLEVDEISNDSETGEMPSFNKYNSVYSSSSSVEIKNNTGCELVVRYSGPDVEMVVIPIGGTRTVNLSNGTYKIAASACGSNYANSESLYGDYGSTFYITTTRY